MTEKLNNKNIITSALKIFDVLELIVKNKDITLTEISQTTGYTKSTSQRILNTLKYLNYIDQDPSTFQYYPTMKINELGNHILTDSIIKQTSKKHMESMSKEINETINLGILDNHAVIYLDKVLSTSPLRVDIDSSMDIPLYCSALGKSIAAFSGKDFSFEKNYIKHTENTILSDKHFQSELSKIKELGYAIDNEEFVEGLICIGVPIFNKSNKAIASLSISIPKIRFKEENIMDYTNLLKKYTQKIENDLYKK